MSLQPVATSESEERTVPLIRLGSGGKYWLVSLLVTVTLLELVARTAAPFAPERVVWYDAAAQIRIEMAEGRDDLDVVFVGTSMAWQGFVPAVFSKADPAHRTAFNAGLAGAVPVVTERWLVDEIVPRLNPNLVVWGLSSLDLSSSYGEDQLRTYRDAPATRPGFVANVDRWLSARSSIFAVRRELQRPSRLFGTAAEATERSFDEARTVTGSDGERLNFEPNLSAELAAVQRARLRDPSPDTDDIAAVIRVIEVLRARSIEVVLVELPVPDRFVELHPNGRADYERFSEALSRIGSELGVQVILLGEAFPDSSFVDFTHLNADAAESLTMTVAAGLDAR